MAAPSPDVVPRVDASVLRALAEAAHGPCLTVTLPVDERSGDSRRLRTAWHSACERAEERLRAAGVAEGEARAFRERLEGLDLSLRSLPHPTRTLVALASPEALHTRALARVDDERVVAGRAFALRPLLVEAQRNRPFRVLAVSEGHVTLYGGDADGLRPLPVPDLPGGLEEVLGRQLEPQHLQYHSTAAGGRAPVFHGQGGAPDERRADLDRFCKAIAKALSALPAHPDDPEAPLLLAADEAIQGHLRALVEKGVLHEKGIPVPPDGLAPSGLHALHQRAVPVAEEIFAERECREMGSLERARAKGKYAEGADELAKQAVAGRIRRLWLRVDAHVDGRLDESEARVVPSPAGEDVLDELAAVVLRHGGEVRAVDSMPDDLTAAAELR